MRKFFMNSIGVLAVMVATSSLFSNTYASGEYDTISTLGGIYGNSPSVFSEAGNNGVQINFDTSSYPNPWDFSTRPNMFFIDNGTYYAFDASVCDQKFVYMFDGMMGSLACISSTHPVLQSRTTEEYRSFIFQGIMPSNTPSYHPEAVGTFKWYYSEGMNSVLQKDSKTPNSDGKNVADLSSLSGREQVQWIASPNGDTIVKSYGPTDFATWTKTVYVDRMRNGTTTNILTGSGFPSVGNVLFDGRSPTFWSDGTIALPYFIPMAPANGINAEEWGFYIMYPDGTNKKVMIPSSIGGWQFQQWGLAISRDGNTAVMKGTSQMQRDMGMNDSSWTVVNLLDNSVWEQSDASSTWDVYPYFTVTGDLYFERSSWILKIKDVYRYNPATHFSEQVTGVTGTIEAPKGVFFPSYNKFIYRLDNIEGSVVYMRDTTTGTDTPLPLKFWLPIEQMNGAETEARMIVDGWFVFKTMNALPGNMQKAIGINLSNPSETYWLFEPPMGMSGMPELDETNRRKYAVGIGQTGMPPVAPTISNVSVTAGNQTTIPFTTKMGTTYSFSGLPTGLSYDGFAVVGGVVTADQGVYHVTLTASNGNSAQDASSTFDITVNAAPSYNPSAVSFSWTFEQMGNINSLSSLEPNGTPTTIANLEELGLQGASSMSKENLMRKVSPTGQIWASWRDSIEVSPRYWHVAKVQSGALVEVMTMPFFEGMVDINSATFYKNGALSMMYNSWGATNDMGKIYVSASGEWKLVSGTNNTNIDGIVFMDSIMSISPDGMKTIRRSQATMKSYVHDLTLGTLTEVSDNQMDAPAFDQDGNVFSFRPGTPPNNQTWYYWKFDTLSNTKLYETSITGQDGMMPTGIFIPTKNKLVYQLRGDENAQVYVKNITTGVVTLVPFKDFRLQDPGLMFMDRMVQGDWLLMFRNDWSMTIATKAIAINLNDAALSTWLFPFNGIAMTPMQDSVINANFGAPDAPLADTSAPTAPIITGVTEGAVKTNSAMPTWSEVQGVTYSATLDGNPFVKSTRITSTGSHVIVVTATKTANNLTASTTVNFSIVEGSAITAPVIAEKPPAECSSGDSNAGLTCSAEGKLVPKVCKEPVSSYGDKVFIYRSSALDPEEFKLFVSDSETQEWKQVGDTVKIAGSVSEEGTSVRNSTIDASKLSDGKAAMESFLSEIGQDGVFVRDGGDGFFSRAITKESAGTQFLQFGTKSVLFDGGLKNMLFNYVLGRMSGVPVEFVAKGCSGSWDAQVSANVVGIIDGDNGSTQFVKSQGEFGKIYQ